MKPKFWNQAKKELAASDPILAAYIERYQGECLRSRGAPFETLLRSIVGQQISVKAAESVWKKLSSTVNTQSPEALLQASTVSLREAGLSQRKSEYAQDLAQHFSSGKFCAESLAALEDEAVIERLVEIRGIGRWTAEMFLIFCLLRPNIFPAADLGLQKGIALAYRKRYPLSKRQLEIFRKKYSPWASVATWYLWRSLDPIPVEY